MSTEYVDGYDTALTEIRATIQHRLSETGVSEDGMLELLALQSMLDDMPNAGKRDEDSERSPPVPMSGSF